MTDALLIPAEGGLAQGDLIIAPLARVMAADPSTPDRWDRLDEHEIRIRRNAHEDEDIHLAAGRAVLMVTSHDCHHDKEWNEAVRRMVKSGKAQEAAEELAEMDETLDRTFQASPVVLVGDFHVDKRRDLRDGRIAGFFPLPSNVDAGFSDAVVDLTYRVTIDRFSMERHLFGLDALGRSQLRLCLARFDALRSVNLGVEIEAVVGQRIATVAVSKGNPIEVNLTLDDGTEVRLLQQPAEPGGGGRTRP